jgi:SH3 domain-containing YSC84-like protein 1
MMSPSSHTVTYRCTAALAGMALAIICAVGLRAQSEEADRIRAATEVLREAVSMPDKAIPQDVLVKAQGIVVVPSIKKGGFVIGGQWGRGVLSARSVDSGTWSAPAFLTITGGSVGLQIGAQEIDLVLVIMERKGLERLVANQFKLGVDASVAAGPIGRDAQAATDVQMRAKILGYSRARGLFAGVTVNGGTIRQDLDANERFYARRYTTRDIVLERLGSAPDPVPAWRDLLIRATAPAGPPSDAK